MGADLIDDYGQRSDWDQERITRCITQWSQWPQWLGLTDWDYSRLKVRTMEPPLIWVALETSKRWDVLREYAQLILSLPTDET
jgi:hypothetical protein